MNWYMLMESRGHFREIIRWGCVVSYCVSSCLGWRMW